MALGKAILINHSKRVIISSRSDSASSIERGATKRDLCGRKRLAFYTTVSYSERFVGVNIFRLILLQIDKISVSFFSKKEHNS